MREWYFRDSFEYGPPWSLALWSRFLQLFFFANPCIAPDAMSRASWCSVRLDFTKSSSSVEGIRLADVRDNEHLEEIVYGKKLFQDSRTEKLNWTVRRGLQLH